MIRFNLSRPTPLLNQTLRQHWAKRRQDTVDMSWEIKVQTQPLTRPIEKAVMTIERRSVKEPDQDNFVGGCKGLVDACVSMGFLVDDSPAHLTVEYRAVKVPKLCDQGTTVTIEAEDL